jgi:hypothetical protein
LKGTYGYKLFALIGFKEGHGAMELFVAKGGEEAIYEAKGEVTLEQVDIDLGALGKVDVEERPTGKTEIVRTCGKPTKVPGYEFVGTIEIHGEEGFTGAIVTHTKLRWNAVLSELCNLSTEGEDFGPGTPGVRIRARQKRGPELQLNQNHRGAGVLYGAQIDEQEGAVKVERFVGGRLGAGALSYAPSLGSATFTGAGPFEGKATYSGVHPPQGTHPGPGTWRGDLKVDFPGAAGVRLAGPGFSAAIIHAHHSETRG